MAEIRNIREFGKEVENIVFKIQDAVCIMHSNLNLNQITYSSFISVFKYCGYNNEEDVNVGYYKKAIESLFSRPVYETSIYSLCLGEEIVL